MSRKKNRKKKETVTPVPDRARQEKQETELPLPQELPAEPAAEETPLPDAGESAGPGTAPAEQAEQNAQTEEGLKEVSAREVQDTSGGSSEELLPDLPAEPTVLARAAEPGEAAAVRPKRRRNVGFWSFLAFTAVFAAASAVFILLLFNFSGSTLFKSPADVELPNFFGMELSEVQENPEYSSFEFVIEEQFNTEYDEGIIFAQSPKAPKLVKENATITLRVSKGIQRVEVPSVEGMDSESAKDLLEESGLSVVTRYVQDEDVEDGYAIRTDPEEGENTLGGNTVTLYVSREDNYERVSVPNCVGKSESEAKKTLKAKGFSVSVIEKESSKTPGTVISMSPSGTAIAGSTITITVSKGSQEYNGGDHMHDLEVVQVIPPSSTGYGYTLYRCSICGLETTGNQIPPTG